MKKIVGISLISAVFVFCANLELQGTSQKENQPSLSAAVKDPQFDIQLRIDKKDGVYKVGDVATFTVQVKKDGKAVSGQKMRYTLYWDNGNQKAVDFTSSPEPQGFQLKFSEPGRIIIETAVLDADGKIIACQKKGKKANASSSIGVIADPHTFRPILTEPADFQQFWDNAKAELAKIPVKAQLEKVDNVPEKFRKDFNIWDVKVDSSGPAPVSGYLAVPVGAAPKTLPAFLNIPGAGFSGVSLKNLKCFRGMICLDINVHGIPNGKDTAFYEDVKRRIFYNKGSYDREKYYFHDMYLRIVRALDYLKSRPEWDEKNLIVQGYSQGGGLALVAAGLDPQVTLILAGIPAICDLGGPLAGRRPSWPNPIALKDGKPVDPKVAEAMRYYDAAFFAERVKAETYFTIGLLDRGCCISSYTAYNNIPGKKHITLYPTLGHTGSCQSIKFYKRLDQILSRE